MGMRIYDASGTFNPTEHGLKIGDEINIICVGGGQGGAGVGPIGGAGAASSFGNIVTAKGGSANTGQYINPNLNQYGGGCGGFILGSNDWGGLGFSVPSSSPGGGSPPAGSAGSIESHPLNKYQGVSYGGGNSYSFGHGGGGYGAGGGSHGTGGGSSGEVKYAVHRLGNLNNIPVSVGGGGGGGGAQGQNGNPGTTSGGGAGSPGAGNGGYAGKGGGNATATSKGGGGAGGCVIVFW